MKQDKHIYNYMSGLERAIFQVTFRIMAKENLKDEHAEKLLDTFNDLKKYIKSTKGGTGRRKKVYEKIPS